MSSEADMNLPSPTETAQQNSTKRPPKSPDSSRKRARPTLSCLECRRKKLKCDRVQPCSQCIKINRPGACVFANGPPGPPPSTGPDDPNRAWSRNDMYPPPGSHNAWSAPLSGPPSSAPINPGMRVQDLCASAPNQNYYGMEAAPPSFQEGYQPPRGTHALEQCLGRIRVQGLQSRFEGPCDLFVMLDHFEDAKNFIMTCCKGHELPGLMKEVKAFQQGFATKYQWPPYQTAPGVPFKAEMFKMVPQDDIWNATLACYIENWENVLRVLHIPSFIAATTEVQEIRRLHCSGYKTAAPSLAVVAQMLLVTAIASRLRGTMGGPETSEMERARYCEIVQVWLQGLQSSDMLHIEILRVQTLLLIARQANLVPVTELWQESGTLVRAAMLMGLQRDPEGCSVLSCFEKEHRRKLWSTILELDFQTSLACDMPPMVRWLSIVKGSLPTLNIDDIDLLPNTPVYPPSKPLHQYTNSVAQITLTYSLIERLALADLMGGNNDFNESLESLLRRAIALETGSCSPRSMSETALNENKSPGRRFAKIMLEVYHHRPLLHVFRNIASDSQPSRCPEARKRALQYSVSLLSHLDTLDPATSDDDIKTRDYLDLFHILCKEDIIQAALVLCYEIQAFNSSPEAHDWNQSQQSTMRYHALPENSIPWTKHNLIRIADHTLKGLLERLGDFGCDFKDILALSTVLQSVRCNGSTEDKHASMLKGVERVLIACRERLPRKAITPLEESNISHHQQAPGMPSPAPTEALSDGKPAFPYQQQALLGGQVFGDANMIPGAHVDFSDFDFAMMGWDQPWG